jgi:CheY-like chemotaxis protein
VSIVPAVLGGVSILVVEDDEATRYAWCRYLAFAGATVVAAEDGRQALQALNAEAIDVLVIDLTVPDIDGFQVWAGARRSQGLAAIAVTAFDDDRQRSRAIEVGFAAYLVKPLLPSVLAQEIVRIRSSP